MHSLLKIVSIISLLLLKGIKSQDYNEKYCNNNCTVYYDGCNRCECGMECVQQFCETTSNDYCISCESNLIWSDCAGPRSETCEELISGAQIAFIQECFQKCTCPTDYRYWNGTHCVNEMQCYNDISTKEPTMEATNMPSSTRRPTYRPVVIDDFGLNIFTIDPTMKPSSVPSISAPVSARPTNNPTTRPTLSAPISTPPTKPPTIIPSMSQPISARPTKNPTIIPTMSQPISARPTLRPSNRPTNRPTGRRTKRPTNRPTSQPIVF